MEDNINMDPLKQAAMDWNQLVQEDMTNTVGAVDIHESRGI